MAKHSPQITALLAALHPRYREVCVQQDILEAFARNLQIFLAKHRQSEEALKSDLRDFLRDTFYHEFDMPPGEDHCDLRIQEKCSVPVKVIIEVKSPSNSAEMCTSADLNRKALQELAYYFMQERCEKQNVYLRHLIATNGEEFFVFDAQEFERKLYPRLKRSFTEFRGKTQVFYSTIAAEAISAVQTTEPLHYTYFSLQSFAKEIDTVLSGKKSSLLLALYKFLSPTHLLKLQVHTDPNQLDRTFYNELLHILGLEERKEKGSKMVIARKRQADSASLLEQTLAKVQTNWIDFETREQYGTEYDEQVFNISLELCTTWLNRILFLKLLEAQLLAYNGGASSFHFLSTDLVHDFAELNDLFFTVLAIHPEERTGDFARSFPNIPYLNSSLFERTELEKIVKISALNTGAQLPLLTRSVLHRGQQIELAPTLKVFDYLFRFLDAYDFSSYKTLTGESSKTLINASVLGLIFEKINGHKDGAIFTPGYITSFICRETIRRTVVEKFNDHFCWQCSNLTELQNQLVRNKIKDEEAMQILNSLRICDPAVGSGHFLVAALNELVYIKYELNLLVDRMGCIVGCPLKVEDDELVVYDRNGEYFAYNYHDPKSQRIQEALFNEKRYIIEHCLFGVDINPTSVQICRLRLWIELLKHAYYTPESDYKDLETLPNIDINIKCGNSLVFLFPLQASLGAVLRARGYSAGTIQESIARYQHASDKNEKYEIARELQQTVATLRENLHENHTKYIALIQNRQELDNLRTTPQLFARNAKEQKVYEKKLVALQKRILELEDYFTSLSLQKTFEWRIEFPEVWDAEGNFRGFDCIVGNPPYIQLQSIKTASEQLQKLDYETYNSMGDIYALFYELGYRLLRAGGRLSFITSNKWMRAAYGRELRNFFATRTNPELLIDFSGVQIFENASVDTNILTFKKETNRGETRTLTLSRLQRDVAVYLASEQNYLVQEFADDHAWIIMNEIEARIKEKIEKVGTPLSEWDVRINRGITTGYNEAFIITEEKRSEILAACQSEEERERTAQIIRPILRGRDIRRYRADWNRLYLINSHNGYIHHKEQKVEAIPPIEINEYPALKAHLNAYEPKLSARCDQGSTPYNLRSCNYMDDFFEQKIVYSEIVSEPQFYFDRKGEFFPEGTTFIMVGERLEYLIKLLNSRIVGYIFKNFYAGGMLGENYRYKEVFLHALPLPKYGEIETKDESRIEEKICELYGFNTKEKEYILQKIN